MVYGCGKKQWVAPILEKIEMAQTAQLCPSTGDTNKQNENTESGVCGRGPGS